MAKRRASSKQQRLANTDDSEGRLRIIKVRLTESELKILKVAAALSGTTAATYARDAALAAAEKSLKAHGIKGV